VAARRDQADLGWCVDDRKDELAADMIRGGQGSVKETACGFSPRAAR
jgi:hypothetical protein